MAIAIRPGKFLHPRCPTTELGLTLILAGARPRAYLGFTTRRDSRSGQRSLAQQARGTSRISNRLSSGP